MTGNFLILALVLLPFLGALAVKLIDIKCASSKRALDSAALITAFAELFILCLAIFAIPARELCIKAVEGFGLNLKLDGFRIVYAFVTCIMWLCSGMLTAEYFHDSHNLSRYYVFSFFTFAATVGVFVSADFITTFTFFEIMSLSSYVYVAHTEKKESMRAAETYLAVAVIGGLVMLMGIMMLYNRAGTLDYSKIKEACNSIRIAGDFKAVRDINIAGALILFGFGAKAGMFPLHIWLPKAHPVAPAPSSALLSGVLTKSGIFGILILSLEVFKDVPGFGLCIVFLGVATMLIGAILAVFSIDLKRTLACSSVSQIGFILVGVGLVPLLGEEECTLALSGALLYMVNHSMFKLTLFLCAGAIYMKCHVLDLNLLRGYGRNMPLLKVIFAIGALGISGVPLLSGYVSKTLIHEGIVEFIEFGNMPVLFKVIEILFLISGGMTFSYMMKLFHAIFVDEPSTKLSLTDNDKRIKPLSYVSVAIPALIILVFGVGAKFFINVIGCGMTHFNTFAFGTEHIEKLEELKIFSLENLKGSMISLAIGTVFFLLIRRFLTVKDKECGRVYVNRWPAWLDLEELVYRPLLCRFFPFIFRTVGRFIATTLVKSIWKGIMYISSKLALALGYIVKASWRGIMFIVTKLGIILGNSFAGFIDMLQHTVFKEINPNAVKRVSKYRQSYENAESDAKIVTSGISYGLMLICIGLCITLFYLLYLLIF